MIYDNVKSNCNERKIPISQLEKELGFQEVVFASGMITSREWAK